MKSYWTWSLLSVIVLMGFVGHSNISPHVKNKHYLRLFLKEYLADARISYESDIQAYCDVNRRYFQSNAKVFHDLHTDTMLYVPYEEYFDDLIEISDTFTVFMGFANLDRLITTKVYRKGVEHLSPVAYPSDPSGDSYYYTISIPKYNLQQIDRQGVIHRTTSAVRVELDYTLLVDRMVKEVSISAITLNEPSKTKN